MLHFNPALRTLCGLAAGLIAFASCSDDEQTPPYAPAEVKLDAFSATPTSIRFRLTATGADHAWYLVVPADRPAPDAAAIAATGAAADVSQPGSYTIDGLEPQTEYLVSAVAARDGVLSEVAAVKCPTVLAPGIELAAAEGATFLTGGFTARIVDADRAAWLLLPEGAEAGAGRILTEGAPIEADGGTHEISLNDPEPGTVYRVAVAAANPDAESVEVLALTTCEEPSYDYAGICTYAAGTYYGDMDNDQGTGEYFLTLTDAEVTPEGYTASSGFIMQFDLYSLLAPDKMRALPQSGLYRFVTPQAGAEPGQFVDACTEWSIGGVNSIWRELGEDGVVDADGYLTDATLEYRDAGDGTCRIAAYAVFAGKAVKMRWDGPLRFDNRIPGELQDLDATGFAVIEARYLGRKNTAGADEFVIRLADDGAQPRNSLVLDFYTSPATDPLNPRISAGEYGPADWFGTDPFTFSVGDIAFGSILMGSYAECTVDGLPMQAIIYDGTFTVTDEGDGGYRFTFDLKICDTDNTLSRTVKGTTLCSFPIENEYPIPPGDLQARLDRVNRALYNPVPSPGGGCNYRIELCDCPFATREDGTSAPASGGGGNRLILDLWGAASPDPAAPELPEGTYWMDYSQSPGTCHGQFTLLEHFDPNGNLCPLSFWNASVKVEREGNGYTLHFSGEDMLNEQIVCDYSGPIVFDAATAADGNKAVRPASAGGSTPGKPDRSRCVGLAGARFRLPGAVGR